MGCHIGSHFVGALAYADDLVLLAPSANAMRRMLQVCDDYAAQYNVLFNATKSKCLCCHSVGTPKYGLKFVNCQPFYIGSKAIEFVERWPHLGHIISNDCDDADDILSKKLTFIGQANKVLYNFRHVDCITKTKLVNAYCTSFYGPELWDLSHRDIESVCTAWRKGLRRIWQLPRATHSVLLPRLSNTVPIFDMFYKRMLNFVHRCLTSDSSLVSSIMRQAILHGQANSIIGRNVINCCLRYHVTIDAIMTSSFRHYHIDKFLTQTDASAAIADWLTELLLCRDRVLHLSGGDFGEDDLRVMIDLLCVSPIT